jgi:hypothetical protein
MSKLTYTLNNRDFTDQDPSRAFSAISRNITKQNISIILDYGDYCADSFGHSRCRHRGDRPIVDITWAIPEHSEEINLTCPNMEYVHNLFRVFSAFPKSRIHTLNLDKIELVEHCVVRYPLYLMKEERTINELVNAFKALSKSIKVLGLRRTGLGKIEKGGLASLFSALPRGIRTLDVSDNDIGIILLRNDYVLRNDLNEYVIKRPRSQNQMIEAFRALPESIEALNLAGNSLGKIWWYGNTGLTSIFSELPRGITTLDVSENYLELLNDKALIQVFTGLPDSLIVLNISKNNLSKKSNDTLVQLFLALPESVTTLDLSETTTGDYSYERILTLAPLLPQNIQWLYIDGKKVDLDEYRADSLILQVREAVATSADDQPPEFGHIRFSKDIDEYFLFRLIQALQAKNNAISNFVIALLLDGRIHNKAGKKKDITEYGIHRLIEAIRAYRRADEDPSLARAVNYCLWEIKALYTSDNSHNIKFVRLKEIIDKLSIHPPIEYISSYTKFKQTSDLDEKEEKNYLTDFDGSKQVSSLTEEKSQEPRLTKDFVKSNLQELQHPNAPAKTKHQEEEKLDNSIRNSIPELDSANRWDKLETEYVRKLGQECDIYQSHLLKQYFTVLCKARYTKVQQQCNFDITRNKLDELPPGKHGTMLKLIVNKYNKVQELRESLEQSHRDNNKNTLEKFTGIRDKINHPDFINTINMHRDSAALRFIKNFTFLISSLLCGIGLIASYKSKRTFCFWRSNGSSFHSSMQDLLASCTQDANFYQPDAEYRPNALTNVCPSK